ncbi:hypothetical protein D9619_013292 [Psilocybe cf. subviscida]|uniref:Uncharacterized protein n=1 Tax=Psilocybe cf. subviscida TaxID=2480587 RepID=A0A8H5BST6_9AGAR|nr:hypothetical protein D9619_013292 [Psilocybe cf. subviscida]
MSLTLVNWGTKCGLRHHSHGSLWTRSMIYLADPQREKRREVMRGKAKEKPTQTSVVANRNGDISMSDTTLNASQDDDDLTDYWDEVATVSREKDVDALEALRHVEEQHEKHLIIRKVVGLSVMFQTTNQRCNALQTFIGVFLQATNCPETLRELLSRLGLSISVNTINKAVNSLSDADKAIEGAFNQLLAVLALVNVDFNLPLSIGTTNEPTLVHLTCYTQLIPAGPLPEFFEAEVANLVVGPLAKVLFWLCHVARGSW